MVLRAHLQLRAFSTTHWLGTFRGPPTLMARPISVSAVNMGRARSRLSGYCQRPVVIIREVERKSGLPIGKIILSASFLVVAGGGYYAYTTIYKPIVAAWKAGTGAKEMAAGLVGYATRKAQEISSAVQKSVGPRLSKVSKELPGIPGAIEGAASGAKRVAISYWERVKSGVEGWRK